MTNYPIIEKKQYGELEIGFRDYGTKAYFNATEMAEIFGKTTSEFLELEQTKKMIAPYLEIDDIPARPGRKISTLEELLFFEEESGMWFHDTIARTFALWLSPKIFIWTCHIVDELLKKYPQEIETESPM